MFARDLRKRERGVRKSRKHMYSKHAREKPAEKYKLVPHEARKQQSSWHKAKLAEAHANK